MRRQPNVKDWRPLSAVYVEPLVCLLAYRLVYIDGFEQVTVAPSGFQQISE